MLFGCAGCGDSALTAALHAKPRTLAAAVPLPEVPLSRSHLPPLPEVPLPPRCPGAILLASDALVRSDLLLEVALELAGQLAGRMSSLSPQHEVPWLRQQIGPPTL